MPQIKIGFFFTAAPGVQVLRLSLARQESCHEIKGGDRCVKVPGIKFVFKSPELLLKPRAERGVSILTKMPAEAKIDSLCSRRHFLSYSDPSLRCRDFQES